MKRLWVTAVPVLLLFIFASIAVVGQQTNQVRVCVVGRDPSYARIPGSLNSGPEVLNQRNLVVKYLNEHKPADSSHSRIQAVPLKSANVSTVGDDANAAGCSYLVTVSCSVSCTRTPTSDATLGDSFTKYPDLSGQGLPPTGPLNFSIMHREPVGYWNGLPDESYNSSKWFAKDIANEVYATILKHP
jgi:hypothetical protein